MRRRVEELFHSVADLSPEERAAFFARRRVGEQTQRAVERLLRFDRKPSAPLDRDIREAADIALARLSPEGMRCGAYRLGDSIGSGGMGAVYLAERVDGEVTHRAAVKLLRPGGDSPALRERFRAERQILAQLSHPHIARLLDAGHTGDGQPYLAMEYVDGRHIDDYAEALDARGKVALFLKVCAAVAYLHRNLVVHRDLKPGNILVDSEGEPKLLDFGIAKMLDLTADATVTGMRILTPDYASPEQALGGPITTATDIYSLGAILYKLLTGAAPRQWSGDGPAATSIRDAEIAPPSKLDASLKGDLEAVLMKALRTEPEERYPSVDAFARDLRAWLELRPVEARGGDVWYRLRRTLRRHWAPATAAGLIAASLAGGMWAADRQRRVAERRFAQLRQLSNRMVDLDKSIRALPGSIEARRSLVAASLEYLEGLSREASGNLELTQEIADGYWRLARIQGVNAELNLGDTKKAEESLRKADALIEQMLAARPDDRAALFRSALVAHDRMIVSDTEQRDEQTAAQAARAAARLEEFLRQPATGPPVRMAGFLRPGDPRDAERAGAAAVFVNVALTHVNLRSYAAGARYAERALELARPIASAQDIASQALSVLANSRRSVGDLDGALAAIRESRELVMRARYPNETSRQFAVYAVLIREGRILGEHDAPNLGRPEEAAGVMQQALDVTDEMARRSPGDSASRSRMGTTARELGAVLAGRDPARALAVYDLGIARLAELRTASRAARQRAELLARSAAPLRRLGRVAEASRRLAEAETLLREIGDYPAPGLATGSPVYSFERALADHAAETGDRRRAIGMYTEILRKISASRPGPEDTLPAAGAFSSLYAAMSRIDPAWTAKRVALWRSWSAKLPGNAYVEREARAAHADQARVAPRL